jgi:5-formyltetrahydrofolate cyclo-ligase
MTHSPKRQLRDQMRRLRRGVARPARERHSRAICDRVQALAQFQRCRTLALYWPLLDRGEVDVRSLDQAARGTGKRVFYPFMSGAGSAVQMGFAAVERTDCLRDRGRGFSEPDPSGRQALPGELELIVVPALAATPAGHRLGHGSGFYDVVLARFRPPACSIVVVYSCQLLDRLPLEPHDMACDLVVTEQTPLGQCGGG